MVSNWTYAYGTVFSLGALATLALGLLPPKTSNILGLSMMFFAFCLWFMAAVTEWYAGTTTNSNGKFREIQANQVATYVCLPMMWWLICHLFLSMGTPDHQQSRVLVVISALNVAFILIFYGIMACVMYTNDYEFMPLLADGILDLQRYIYWITSLVALFMLWDKHKTGQLAHVSDKCLTLKKINFLIFLKFALMGVFFADIFFPLSEWSHFIGNIVLVIWFSMCIRVAAQRLLPAELGQFPMNGGQHGHGANFH
jgi:hypothetical protein